MTPILLIWLGLVGLGLLGVLLYWELVIAEGAHLGPRVVVPLYDRIAHRYDADVKKFDPQTESEILGLPLATELVAVNAPRVLDVACGTGRTARALLREVAFDGTIVSADLGRRMLMVGRATCAPWPGRVAWVQAAACPLPFPADAFDCVTCLEALEFLPDPRAALAECVRVLKPGGLLVITNRIGWQAHLLFGKTFSAAALRRLLADLGLEHIRLEAWTTDYDLAWARKSWISRD
ncbi:MAG: class I SAM-dependent methyltransferase [Thermoflexales bacterium]|nr:class I SAM-dependent methyltransferase [Thermoflexales bacterium]